MILFRNDWQKYPKAVIDVDTKNKSFLRVASLYRTMGIENNSFMLATLNPELIGVDPFDPKLSIEQMAMIALEIRDNPWWYFRNIARAPAIAGRPSVMVEANRGNIALWWLFFNHVMTILTQSRQTGKSFSTDVLVTLLMNVLCTNTQINLLTKDDILRRRNIERLKEIASELPRYLDQKTKLDVNNGEELTIRSLNNSFITHVPQASPKRAYNLGRGLTSPIFIVDEGPFQPNIAIALPAALAATGAAVDAAKLANAPYGTILTNTAGKKDDKDGKFVFRLISESAVWAEPFFDAKDQDDLERLIKHNSRTGAIRVSVTLSHTQLGKTDEWLKTKLDDSLQTGDDASRDYFNVWTSGSESNPLSDIILEKIANSLKPVSYTDISKPHGYVTRWYVSEEKIHNRLMSSKFILGIDTSDASGGDDIGCVMVDVETLEVIMTGVFNETNLIMFSEWLVSIMVSYVNITTIIERRSTGGMIMDYLLLMLPEKGIDPFKRIFNRVVNDYDEYPERYSEIKTPMVRRSIDIYVKYKKTFGFATSAVGYASRSEIYSTTLQNAAKRGCNNIYDKELIGQITGLVSKNGRVDHEVGEHDDLVIGWLLTQWLILHGKNLSFYGIDTSKIMSNLGLEIGESKVDIENKLEQQLIRTRIESIYDQLTKETDDFVSLRLEHELRVLDKQIILESDEVYSLDGLIERAKEVKKNKRRTTNFNKQDSIDFRNGYADNRLAYSDGVYSDRPLTTFEIANR